MDAKAKVLIGAGAIIAAVVAAVIVFAPVLVAVFLGSANSQVAGVASGLLANQEFQEGDTQCIVEGGNGNWEAVTASQEDYVKSIVGVAKGLGVSEKGQIVAVMVMLQESGIQNYANSGKNQNGYTINTAPGTQFWLNTAKLSMKMPHDAVGNDADSVGLFQQRASAGWADTDGFTAVSNKKEAVTRLMNPEFGARGFFGGPGHIANRGLLDISGWEGMAPTVAAQTVQGSAYPAAYAKWEAKARKLVKSNKGAPKIDKGSDGSSDSSSSDSPDPSSGTSVDLQEPMKEDSYELKSGFGQRGDPANGGQAMHNGLDYGADLGTPILAAADGKVSAVGPASGFGNWVVIDHDFGGRKYSTVYGHMTASSIKVKKGDDVTAGTQIATVGDEATSTGPHLHFEVWSGGKFDGGNAVDPKAALAGSSTGDDSNSGGGDTCSTGDVEGAGPDTGSVAVSGPAGKVIDAGRKWLGTDYSWGGGTTSGPSRGFGAGAPYVGFDCSSLMQNMIYNGTKSKTMIPRTSGAQYQATKGDQIASASDAGTSSAIDKGNYKKLKAGDLLFYSKSGAGGIYHVSMYIGGGQMIEAPTTGDEVKITDVRMGTSFFAATRIGLDG